MAKGRGEMMKEVPLPESLSEFRDSKYWDAFFTVRGGRPFEWYGEWKDVSKLVLSECRLGSLPELSILVPGCGNSALSADMYDAGLKNITNIDFSRVVIAEMLRQHVRVRTQMRWVVMDMTNMQFPDESFHVVVDKGGLDALTGEPDEDPKCGVSFLTEVQRVLKGSGSFVCITLAQKHVIDLLLSTFRQGWQVIIHALQISFGAPSLKLRPFLVIAKKESRQKMPLVSFGLDCSWQGGASEGQMQSVIAAVDKENMLRSQGLIDDDKNPFVHRSYKSSEDSFEELNAGRRMTVKLGGSGRSQYTYSAIVLDAKEDASKPEYRCAVFLVPKGRSHEWLFSSVEGQWQVADSAKAGRLILVILDVNQYVDDILSVKDDLSPLVKFLLPADCRDGANIPYLTQGNGIASRNLKEEIISPLTGAMMVEDVILAEESAVDQSTREQERNCFRRLVFRRNPNLIQSEALLIKEKGAVKHKKQPKSAGEMGRKHGAYRRRSKGTKDSSSMTKQGRKVDLQVDHSFLASPYHEGMITALTLIANNLEEWVNKKQSIRVMVVGLGAGLLPMFVHNHLPVNEIQVVELDPVVGDLAKRHFNFIETDRMKLEIGDGVAAVQAIAGAPVSLSRQCETNSLAKSLKGIGKVDISRHSWNSVAEKANAAARNDDGQDRLHNSSATLVANKLSSVQLANDQDNNFKGQDIQKDQRLHILIIDADSEDPSCGLSCPPQEFIEDPFLHAARGAILPGGLLIVNVVSRAVAHHVTYVAQLKRFFEEVYDIEVNEDVNRVLIALPQERNVGTGYGILEAVSKLEKLAQSFAPWGNGPDLKKIVKDLKRLK